MYFLLLCVNACEAPISCMPAQMPFPLRLSLRLPHISLSQWQRNKKKTLFNKFWSHVSFVGRRQNLCQGLRKLFHTWTRQTDLVQKRCYNKTISVQQWKWSGLRQKRKKRKRKKMKKRRASIWQCLFGVMAGARWEELAWAEGGSRFSSSLPPPLPNSAKEESICRKPMPQRNAMRATKAFGPNHHQASKHHTLPHWRAILTYAL